MILMLESKDFGDITLDTDFINKFYEDDQNQLLIVTKNNAYLVQETFQDLMDLVLMLPSFKSYPCLNPNINQISINLKLTESVIDLGNGQSCFDNPEIYQLDTNYTVTKQDFIDNH